MSSQPARTIKSEETQYVVEHFRDGFWQCWRLDYYTDPVKAQTRANDGGWNCPTRVVTIVTKTITRKTYGDAIDHQRISHE